MKAFQLHGQSGPESLRLVEIPEPQPGPGQVLIRVRANSLNYRDLMIADGRYGKINLPLVPLSDGAGEIVAVGPTVTRWQVGDRVAGAFFQGWSSGTYRRENLGTALGGALGGMLAEFVVLSEDGVVAIPPHLSFAEAATLPCAGVTAWHALVGRGQVGAHETVLLLGTGGVSLFALQIARLHGARTLITSGSDEKLARASRPRRPADATINFHRTTPDWDEEVFRLTHKHGVDHVVEVGGTGTFPKSLRSLAANGTMCTWSVASAVLPATSRSAKSSADWPRSMAYLSAAGKCLKPSIAPLFRTDLNRSLTAFSPLKMPPPPTAICSPAPTSAKW